MKRILLLTVFLLASGVYLFSQSVFVHWNNVNLTYNGALQAPTAYIDTMGTYINLDVSGAQINVGGYVATATIPGPPTGFVLQNPTQTFFISAYMITIQWGSRGLTYTGAAQTPSASAIGVVGENLPLSISGAGTNAGTGYTAYATLSPSNPNYYINHSIVGASDTLNFYINRATIPVVWTNTTLTHTGSPLAPTATVTGFLNETVPVGVTGAQTNVGGPYTATAALSAPNALPGSNYTLSNPTTQFNIVASPANNYTIVWSNTSLTYTGAPQAPTAVATNTLGQNIAVTVTGAQTNAGAGYTATATLTVPNPAITLNNSTTTFVIAPATVPVVWGDTTLIFTGSPQAPTATATGVLNENLPLSVTGTQSDVGGPYTATASFTTPNNNYTLSNTSTLFIIIDYYTVEWSNRSLTFTGYTQGPTAIATNTTGLNIAITVTGAQINAAYGLTATAALTTPNSNIILVNATTTFVIQPATVPVQWDNTTLTYTGNPQAPTATCIGVMDENLPLIVTGAQTDIGTGYTATATLNTNHNNYRLSNPTTRFEIVQQPVITDPFTYTVLWDRTPLTYTGNPQKPTATASNELGDSIAISVTGAKTNVGIGYLALAELSVPDGRITLLNAMMMFEIVPAAIPVAWGSAVLYYTGSPQAPTASLKDLMGEDMPLNISGAQTNVGTGYTATAWLRTPDNNYTLTNTTILFSIVQATPYVVEWGNKSLTYNGNPQAPTATATNDQGQSVAITVKGAQTNVGTAYTATAELTVPNNSIVLNNTTTLFDITPAPLDVAAVSETIVYGQTPVLAYTLRSGRLFGNDALTGALSVETLQGTSPQTPYPVGEYVIAQGTLAANRNYTINFTKGSLTVIESNQFDIIVNSKSATHEDDKYYGEPAENGEDQAEVYVLANPGETIEIGGQRENPRTVALPLYGDNLFTITVTPLNGTPQNHTLIIERYYEKVFFEYPDIPTISCNPLTNGGLTFSGFQWYREGEPMEDATTQYIRVNDNATYYCILTPNDYPNVKLRTINVRSKDLNASGNLTAYPNPTQGKVTLSSGANARTGESTNGRRGEAEDTSIRPQRRLSPATRNKPIRYESIAPRNVFHKGKRQNSQSN